MVSEAEVRTVVADVLRQRFANEDLLRSDVELAEDFDGEQVVRVTAHFERTAASALALFAASDEIRDRLKRIGDERFVFIRQDVRDEPGGELGDEGAQGRPS